MSVSAATGNGQEEGDRPPLPPFTRESAMQKVRLAEDAWNTKKPVVVAQAYTVDTHWRNRSQFLNGRHQVRQFLARKWASEVDYRLIKELWTHDDERIAVRFAYEWRDRNGQWFRSYGNENWLFAADGRMRVRHASINDVSISEADRLFHWPSGSRRPLSHPGLSDLRL